MAHQGRKNADDGLLLSLACGATVENAARAAGVSERTVYRRLKSPAFRQQLQQRRGDLVQRAAGVLTAASMEAIKTLLELQKATAPAPVQLGAARCILELGLKLREAADVHQRVETLEGRLQALESDKRVV
jgi:hypothetical protein